MAIDLVRRRSRRRTSSLDDCSLLEASEEHADHALDAERASQVLRVLPSAQRVVIYLKHFADCSFREIGRITGVSTFTAASRYRLGMAKMRKLLEGGA
jgi:RNA polymerase sigma-70 factor (ECF subfamily)